MKCVEKKKKERRSGVEMEVEEIGWRMDRRSGVSGAWRKWKSQMPAIWTRTDPLLLPSFPRPRATVTSPHSLEHARSGTCAPAHEIPSSPASACLRWDATARRSRHEKQRDTTICLPAGSSPHSLQANFIISGRTRPVATPRERFLAELHVSSTLPPEARGGGGRTIKGTHIHVRTRWMMCRRRRKKHSRGLRLPRARTAVFAGCAA